MTPAASTTQLCSITRPFSLLHDLTVLDYRTINWSARPFLKSATQVAEAGYVRRVAFVHNSNMFVIGTINALLWMRSVENTYTRTMSTSTYPSFTHAYRVQTQIRQRLQPQLHSSCNNPNVLWKIILNVCIKHSFRAQIQHDSPVKPAKAFGNYEQAKQWCLDGVNEHWIRFDQSRDKLSESKCKLRDKTMQWWKRWNVIIVVKLLLKICNGATKNKIQQKKQQQQQHSLE